jgi:serine/threonine protein kinase
MSRNTQRNKRGGKFLYSGTYGCAFKPAIKCRGQHTRKNGHISKIMNAKNGFDEKQMTDRVIKTLNSDFKYFVYPDEICIPEPNVTNGTKNCKLSFNKPISLLSPYGGKDLLSIDLPVREIPALFEGLVNLFDGLELLHSNGFIHNDVKPSNTVALRRDDGTYNVRLIDFGLLVEINKYINNPITSNYAYYPYDIRLLSDKYFPSKDDIKTFYTHMAYNNFPTWFYFTDTEKTINIKWVMSIWEKMKTKEAQEYVVKQCDVYGLGRTILELYYRLTEQEFIKPGKVLGNPRFLNASSSIEFRKNVSLPLFTLIQKMCAPDPFIRIGLAKAKIEFLALLPALKEAFTFKDIKKNELPSPIEHKHSYNGAIYNL